MHFNAIQCSTWVGVEENNHLRVCISLVEIQRMLARVVKVHQVLATLSTFDQNKMLQSRSCISRQLDFGQPATIRNVQTRILSTCAGAERQDGGREYRKPNA